MEDSSLDRIKIFLEVSLQNDHHCQNEFTNVDISLHMIPEKVLYPSSFHLLKMATRFFIWDNCLTMLCWFLLYNSVNQL